jgi:hypothetical protein
MTQFLLTGIRAARDALRKLLAHQAICKLHASQATANSSELSMVAGDKRAGTDAASMSRCFEFMQCWAIAQLPII